MTGSPLAARFKLFFVSVKIFVEFLHTLPLIYTNCCFLMIPTSFPLYGKDQMSKCSFFCVDLAVTYKQIAVVLILAAV